MLDDRNRRCRIERYTGLLAERANGLQRTMEVRPRLGMDGDDIGPTLGKVCEIGIGRRDHQVAVEHLVRHPADRLHYRRAKADIGNEVTIHHVDMDIVRAGLDDRPDFIPQPRKVGGQDGWRDAKGARGHAGTPLPATMTWAWLL